MLTDRYCWFVLSQSRLFLMVSSQSIYCFESHMLFKCRDAVLDLTVCAFISVSDPSRLSMVMLVYVKLSKSNRASPSSVLRSVSSMLYIRILLLLWCILRPIASGVDAALPVLTCICRCVCGKISRSSAYSKSSGPIQTDLLPRKYGES